MISSVPELPKKICHFSCFQVITSDKINQTDMP
jgi:hypothetical protein